jgi:hypothetical protein
MATLDQGAEFVLIRSVPPVSVSDVTYAAGLFALAGAYKGLLAGITFGLLAPARLSLRHTVPSVVLYAVCGALVVSILAPADADFFDFASRAQWAAFAGAAVALLVASLRVSRRST